ncbi:preprotein translocase subunit SecA [Telmatocola sphagniphila]|uniref:Protein translocase subunit SecA n=1 Tax=Telmatocola sphagniphila TaxID=1123043 RepID=A0A8E6BAF6_9BACT|nr:preprotein translocase subunit SecA [Telmatocola sphagniphila]QVL33365.1 preprotein translocase subunit SecA [Telmatocola sphagniphila]
MVTASTNLDVGVLEKIGEKFSNLAEGATRLLTRMLGSSNERQVRAIGFYRPKGADQAQVIPGSTLSKINAFESQMEALSAEELRGLSDKFRERLKAGQSLEDILPEAFAACREAAKRTKNMRHYDTQMVGGVILHRGGIAEMVTGEGKTLVATLPAYLNALSGEGVHVITVNDYLARRDCEWMLPIYSALGLTAGYIQSDQEATERRKAYECDITYGTNSEFGFDYLRDNMKPARFGDETYHPFYQQVQRKLNYAIIDEVDNILIDEARTPLIISGPAHSDLEKYVQANEIALKLSELEKKERAELAAKGIKLEEQPVKQGEKPQLGIYYEIKEKERSCHLTDKGVRKAEELAGVESFYTPGNMEWPHLIDNALKAHHLYQRDRHYMVMEHERELKIIIIDEFTGRAMFGRQWSDGLHQAVEAKHRRDGVEIKQETQTLATVTLQNFFKLYKKLGGMTGTAMTEANEFWKIYKLDVVAIPTNRAMKRINYQDVVFRSEKEKWDAIINEIETVHATGRPILIGTTDVAKSEKLSGLLKRKGIKHELLNAKPEYVQREAEIVAQAGRAGAVTISTNMAGRGTDIILGGNPETLAWAQLKDQYPTRLEVPEDVWKSRVDAIESEHKMKEAGRKVAEEGGLHIVGTERHESRRIDNQLRGRAGRQGDPGSSRFFLSLQDELMRLYGGEWVASVLTRLGMKDGEAIESRMVSKRIEAAQRKLEESHFEARKSLLEYDEVMDTQRKLIYGRRQEILNHRNCKTELLRMFDSQVEKAVNRYLAPDYSAESFRDFASTRMNLEFEENEFLNANYEDAVRVTREKAYRNVPTVIQEGLDENLAENDDPADWKWQEMTRLINTRLLLNYTEKQLKQIGRENIQQVVLAEANRAVEQVDLSEGEKFLRGDWGHISLIDWAQQKFQVSLDLSDLKNKSDADVKVLLSDKVRESYRQREIAFPIMVALASFMSDTGSQGQRYNREGIFEWAIKRMPSQASKVTVELFRDGSKEDIRKFLLECSAEHMPKLPQEEIDKKLEEAMSGSEVCEPADAQELVDWFKESYSIQIPPESIAGQKRDEARQNLWNVFDQIYRPEMRRMERMMLLDMIDSSWKSHLLTMDHLRAGISLWSYAQIDPKTKYKQDGMKQFEQMLELLEERVCETVFRLEDAPEEQMHEALWAGATATHASVQAFAPVRETPTPNEMSTNREVTKKSEPIRNTAPKVGRNDPCPCGSGKKYKNCHMKLNSPS